MSEPLTPDQAIEILNEKPTESECYAVIDLIRTLAARNAELESEKDDLNELIAEARTMDPSFDCAVRIDQLETALALESAECEKRLHRIWKLEEAARWRSCKDEPPVMEVIALCKTNDRGFEILHFRPGVGWTDRWTRTRYPDEWRII